MLKNHKQHTAPIPLKKLRWPSCLRCPADVKHSARPEALQFSKCLAHGAMKSIVHQQYVRIFPGRSMCVPEWTEPTLTCICVAKALRLKGSQFGDSISHLGCRANIL